METIKVPGVGAQKKEHVYIAVAVVGGIVLLGYYRQKKAAASVVQTTTPQIDPATGYAYGSPEDAQALADNAAYASPGGLTDITGGGSSGGGATYTDSGNGVPTNTTITSYSTNGQWEQAAVDYLSSSVGLNSANVSSALGKFLTGASVVKGSHDESLIHQAIAALGLPPQSGVNGYPPSIHEVAAPPVAPRKKTLYHTIRKGETLSTLSQEFYGNPNEWRVILRANPRVLNQHDNGHTDLIDGKKIRIPDATQGF